MSKKIGILFGAGAEGTLGMPTGIQYKKETIFTSDYKALLGDAFNKKYFNDDYKHSYHGFDSYSKILKRLIGLKINLDFDVDEGSNTSNNDKDKGQNSQLDIEFISKYKDLLSSALNKKEIEKINKKLSEKDKLSEESQKESQKVAEKLKEKLQGSKNSMDNPDDEEDEKGKDNEEEKTLVDSFVEALVENDLANDVCYSLLDEYFHTIINPKKYGKKNFSKIFNYYWSCYYSIVKGILNRYMESMRNDKIKDDNNEFKDYLKKNNPIDVDLPKIINDIDNFTEKIYSIDLNILLDVLNGKDNYYKVLREIAKENKYSFYILTTNYFHYADYIPMFGDKGVAYLNGQLKWFEFPELLEVRDLKEGKLNGDDKNRLYFPFMFGPSLVKPVVNGLQIEELAKGRAYLDSVDTLFIIGYGINSDDNHINSLLHEFLCNENKRIIIASKNNNVEAKKDICRRLRVSEEYGKKIQIINYVGKSCKEVTKEMFECIE